MSAKPKNLYLSLAESMVQMLNVTSCFACGGDQHGRLLGLGKG
jgi:hypothetical protein